ncbi:TetR/AcrR family transcriptional regulator [Mycolicibacterium nivoides]|uniref:TetR/AcrR family transcriptional regulator n=1 Tax=Mycolicibacterium nivoides TaxID=2487344 RepID=UPI003C2BE758
MRERAQRDYGGISAADRRAERRARLLSAGRQAWGESGTAGVTVRGVCALAGLTDRYFYEHFANREALILAVSDEVRDQLLAAMVAAGQVAPGDATVKLQAGLQAFLDAVAGDPHLVRIATSDTGNIPELVKRRRQMLDMIAELVIANAPDAFGADLDPDQLRRAALFAVGGVNQLIEGWLDGSVAMTTAELAAECAQFCMSVLRRRRHTPSGN